MILILEKKYVDWISNNKEKANLLIVGHTHRPHLPDVGKPPYFNTGSCVHPRCITGVEIEKLSEPIIDDTMYTKGGYWLVKVLEKDADRQLDDYDRDRLKSKALEEWVASLWDNPDNLIDDSFLDSEKKAWAMEKAKKGLE